MPGTAMSDLPTRGSRSAARLRGAIHQVVGAGLDPREEACHETADAQLRVALDVAGRDQRTGRSAGLDDLRDRVIDRPLYLGMTELADVTHRGREIARRDEEHVDVVDLQDLIEIADRDDVLEQDDQQALLVRGLEVLAHAEALAAREHAALPERRELPGLDDGL